MANNQTPYENIPKFMYYKTTSTADNSSMWANSLYWPSPTSSTAIPGATRVNWVGTSSSTDPTSPIIINIVPRYAIGFTPNKNELFPIHQSDISLGKLPQDYGY